MESGKFQDAVATLERLIQDNPSFDAAYYQRGRLYSRADDSGHARKMFAKVREMKNAEIREQQLLERIKLGESQKRSGSSRSDRIH